MARPAVRRGAPAARRAEVLDALARHWPEYVMEAAGLAFFVVSASLATTLLEYPGSPVHRAIGSEFGRRVVLGIGMGLVIAAVVYSPWGKRSGAHINPAVTWAFYRLGKIRGWDAAFYTVAQFAGALAAEFVIAFAARHWADLWLYVAAPVVAMLLAAELYLRFGGPAANRHGPTYPVAPNPTT